MMTINGEYRRLTRFSGVVGAVVLIAWVVSVGIFVHFMQEQDRIIETLENNTTLQEIEPVTQLDSLYDLLVGADSLSVLSTAKRVVIVMDSLCIQLSGERCQPDTMKARR